VHKIPHRFLAVLFTLMSLILFTYIGVESFGQVNNVLFYFVLALSLEL
jgi:hypothetical protein